MATTDFKIKDTKESLSNSRRSHQQTGQYSKRYMEYVSDKGNDQYNTDTIINHCEKPFMNSVGRSIKFGDSNLSVNLFIQLFRFQTRFTPLP
jgi:hypothetical protein